jgi:hypothetical protein
MDRPTVRRQHVTRSAKDLAASWIETNLAGWEPNNETYSEEDRYQLEWELRQIADRLHRESLG